MNIDRRGVWKLALVGAVTSTTLVACSGDVQVDIPKTMADIINKVQDAVKKACEAAGKVVPTANSVYLVIKSILNVAPGTPLSVVTVTADVILQTINQIVAVGCPQPTVGGKLKGTTAKGVEVEFY